MTPAGTYFRYWVIQKWDADAQKYVDTDEKVVLPGDKFTVDEEYAKKEADPDNPGKYKYTFKLRAEYAEPNQRVQTHIWWFDNYSDTGAERHESSRQDEDIEINKTISIKDTPTRDGYQFLGWARIPTDTSESEAGNPPTGLVLDLTEDDVYLKYDENVEGKYVLNDPSSEDDGKPVIGVAADERLAYHDMYAVWERIYQKVKIKKVDDSTTPAPLAGAQFTINEETLTSGADGFTEVIELNALSTPYDLTETVTPEGYEGLTGAVPVTVSADGVTIPSTYDKAKVSGPDSDGVYTITVKNVHKALPIRVIKIDQNGDPLEDAVFSFAPGSKTFGDGTTPMVSKIPAGGTEAIIVEDNEVPLGTYLIQEDEAPAGYKALEGGIEIKVEPEDGDIKLTVKIGDKKLDPSHIKRDPETGLRTIEIQNTAGTELPMTGGIGTTILYIAGAILTMISGILLVIRAKQKLN